MEFLIRAMCYCDMETLAATELSSNILEVESLLMVSYDNDTGTQSTLVSL